jgi:hypothetical protein
MVFRKSFGKNNSLDMQEVLMSPIRSLDSCVVNSIARIAPEKFNELESFRIKHSPCAVFTNGQLFKFRVDTKTNEIKLPTKALEYLWCSCYFFYVVYQEYCKAINSNSDTFDLTGNPRSDLALKLYKWGYEQMHSKDLLIWPEDYPRPAAYSGNTDENCLVADELYLSAVAWILHHEMAHIYCAHISPPLNDEHSRAQEKEADKSATQWVLSGILEEDVLRKRGLGVAIAALVITSQDILLGEFKETTHPKSFQRLYDVLVEYFKEEDHLVYAFCTIICHIHMAFAEIPIIKDDSDTWKGNFESCLVVLSRLK